MQKILSTITGALLSRMFFFLYAAGIASSIITLPNTKGAHLYDNLWQELFLDTYIVCIIFLLIPKRLNIKTVGIPLRGILKAVLYTAFYIVYIADTFCYVKFGTTINPSMLMLMGETTGNEASEFLASYVTTEVLFSEVGIMLLIPLLHIITAMAWKKWGKSIARCFCLKPVAKLSIQYALTFGIIGMLTWSGITCYDNKEMFSFVMSRETIGDVEHHLSSRPRVELYLPPYRLVFSIYCNKLTARQLVRLKGNAGKMEIDSCTVKSNNIVFIIGESFNKRHAQLYGYDKPNMPNQMRMEREGNLTKLDDVVAPWNLTSFVFKHLMTTYCVGDTADWCDYPLFCELFRKAGYRVTFLTNQFQTQAKEAVYDFSGGFFLNDQFLNSVQYDIRNEKLHIFDEGLLNDYEDLVASKDRALLEGGQQPSVRNLTIFHLMGMHVNYRIRCPNSKKKFGPDGYPNDEDLTPRNKRVKADYDNAVWYNDSVVNQIVERFRNEDAIIIYMPDHGEEVFGPGARHFFGRMHKTGVNKRLADEEFRIPMWFYCTTKYKKNHPDVVDAIKAAKSKPFMTDAMSHLLLGLAGIHTKHYRPQYDLLSPQYDATRKRLLKHTIDYDKL